MNEKLTQKEKDQLAIFALANEKGKFAIGIGYEWEGDLGRKLEQQEAFEELMLLDAIRLIDVGPIAVFSYAHFRIFMVTPRGRTYRSELNAIKAREETK